MVTKKRRIALLPSILIIAGIVLAGILAAVGLAAYAFFQRDVPERYAGIEDHFKYGSIGAEARTGVPYRIWRILPVVFPEHLPDRPGEGYARFGYLYESPDAQRPIGTSLREKPIPLIGLNCAVCHTGSVRESPDGPAQFILGMPAHQFDLQSYARFLFATAQDERFTPDTLLAAMQEDDPQISWFESQFYRFIVIPQTKDALHQQAEVFSWWDSRPRQGPGRVDTFNPYKVIFFELPLQQDATVGTADLPTLWNQRVRDGLWLHWDGNNDSVEERNRSAALGAGANPDSLDEESLRRVADWILDFPPPAIPTGKVDSARIEAGRQIYQANCAQCHALDGQHVGQVTPLTEIGTDSARLESFTPELAERMKTLGSGQAWQFSHFRKTEGYANLPLDGVWLRSPYLHNGSVPTLRDLLAPSEQRPAEFYRGYDEYDFDDVGFVTSGPAAERSGVRFDTREKGNGNQGHTYGTTLPESQKTDLIEFLKTQ